MKTTITILSLFLLSSCSDTEKRVEAEAKATRDAKSADPMIHRDYLQCYGLDYSKKEYCLRKLEDKYINPDEIKKNRYYKQYFQYEAEKLGFLELLKDNGASCDGIKIAPQFERATEGYVLKCYNNSMYLLNFDYFKQQWVFLK